MNANLEQIKQEILAGAENLNSSKELYEFKKSFLDGKTGKIGLLMREMKNIPNEEKAAYGKGVNILVYDCTVTPDSLKIDSEIKKIIFY